MITLKILKTPSSNDIITDNNCVTKDNRTNYNIHNVVLNKKLIHISTDKLYL